MNNFYSLFNIQLHFHRCQNGTIKKPIQEKGVIIEETSSQTLKARGVAPLIRFECNKNSNCDGVSYTASLTFDDALELYHKLNDVHAER